MFVLKQNVKYINIKIENLFLFFEIIFSKIINIPETKIKSLIIVGMAI